MRDNTKTLAQVVALFAIASCVSPAPAPSHWKSVIDAGDGTQTTNGLVRPLDQAGKNFYLQNEDGLIEVLLAKDAKIGLLLRDDGLLQMFEERALSVPFTGQTIALPQQLYAKVRFEDWSSAQEQMQSGKLSAGILHVKPLEDHLPTEREPWLSGRVTAFKPGRSTPLKELSVGDRRFELSTAGHDRSEQIVGLLGPGAIRPYVNQASVYGHMQGKVFHASEVLLRPIPDQTALDDPELPRYLCIGDSISGNLSLGLEEALAGKLNVHHPPTNCGGTQKGRARANIWLGDYETRGKHWNIISFNFGHGDDGNTKAQYQEDLEAIIRQLERTGAKLVWVTTCPIPNGYKRAGELRPGGKAPGRMAGGIEKYLNPWALEVVQRHPDISVCDLWQYCKDNEDTIFKEWWAGMNVHFEAGPGAALGRFLAEHILQVMHEN